MIGRTAGADDWGAGDPRGAVAGLAFGGGHGAFAEKRMGHGFHSEALRDGTASGGCWRAVRLDRRARAYRDRLQSGHGPRHWRCYGPRSALPIEPETCT